MTVPRYRRGYEGRWHRRSIAVGKYLVGLTVAALFCAAILWASGA